MKTLFNHIFPQPICREDSNGVQSHLQLTTDTTDGAFMCWWDRSVATLAGRNPIRGGIVLFINEETKAQWNEVVREPHLKHYGVGIIPILKIREQKLR